MFTTVLRCDYNGSGLIEDLPFIEDAYSYTVNGRMIEKPERHPEMKTVRGNTVPAK